MGLNDATNHCSAGVYWILVSRSSTVIVLGTAETRRILERASAKRASIQTTGLPGSDGGMGWGGGSGGRNGHPRDGGNKAEERSRSKIV